MRFSFTTSLMEPQELQQIAVVLDQAADRIDPDREDPDILITAEVASRWRYAAAQLRTIAKEQQP